MAVGKTSMTQKFVNPKYALGNHMSTIGVDQYVAFLSFLGEPIKIKIWDTAGQERFGTITKNYTNILDSVLLVFALNNETSFEQTAEWFK